MRKVFLDFEGGDKIKTFAEKLFPEEWENFEERLSPEELEDVRFSMLRLDSREVDLRHDIWLDYYGSTKKISPRLLIDFEGYFRDLIPISIDKFNPQVLVAREVPDFDKVADWIKKNYSVLIRHWNQEIDDADVSHLLFHGVTFHEWQRQHYLLLTRYWNGT